MCNYNFIFSIFSGALQPYSLSTHIFPFPNFRKNSSISTRGETPAHLSMGVIPHVNSREFRVIGFSENWEIRAVIDDDVNDYSIWARKGHLHFRELGAKSGDLRVAIPEIMEDMGVSCVKFARKLNFSENPMTGNLRVLSLPLCGAVRDSGMGRKATSAQFGRLGPRSYPQTFC